MYQGALRFWLALLVVAYHYLHPYLLMAGPMAVSAFFTVSGFLITRVVRARYANGWDGLRRFAANRFLRLYPAYAGVLILALGATLLAPEIAKVASPTMRLPESATGWLSQATILGLAPFVSSAADRPALISVAWSLSVELVFYALIALAFARSARLTLVWWMASLLVMATVIAADRYDIAVGGVLGGSFSFATGALLAFFGERLAGVGLRPSWRSALLFAVIFTALAGAQPVAAVVMVVLLGADLETARAALPIAPIVQLTLAGPMAALALWCAEGATGLSARARAAVTFLGDLSYPLFLVHIPAQVIVAHVLDDPTARAPATILVALATSLAAAAALTLFIERPIERLRARLRSPGAGA